jgi:hypothetical protein
MANEDLVPMNTGGREIMFTYQQLMDMGLVALEVIKALTKELDINLYTVATGQHLLDEIVDAIEAARQESYTLGYNDAKRDYKIND